MSTITPKAINMVIYYPEYVFALIQQVLNTRTSIYTLASPYHIYTSPHSTAHMPLFRGGT